MTKLQGASCYVDSSWMWRVNIALRGVLQDHGNIATEGSPKPGLYAPLLFRLTSRFIVSSTIGITAQSRSLQNHDDNIRPDRDLNQVPPVYESQPDRMLSRNLSPTVSYDRAMIGLLCRLQPDRMSHRGRQWWVNVEPSLQSVDQH